VFGSIFSFKFHYDCFKIFYILSGKILFFNNNAINLLKIFLMKSEQFKKKFQIFIKKEKKKKKENFKLIQFILSRLKLI
jgi:hypothetical protein